MPTYRYPTQVSEEASLVLDHCAGHKVDPKACRQACHALIGFCYAQEDKATHYVPETKTNHLECLNTLKGIAAEAPGTALHAWAFDFASLVAFLQGVIAYLETLLRVPPTPEPVMAKHAPIDPKTLEHEDPPHKEVIHESHHAPSQYKPHEAKHDPKTKHK